MAAIFDGVMLEYCHDVLVMLLKFDGIQSISDIIICGHYPWKRFCVSLSMRSVANVEIESGLSVWGVRIFDNTEQLR